MKFVRVPTDLVEILWDKIDPMFRKCMAKSISLTPDDYRVNKTRLLMGQDMLLLAVEGEEIKFTVVLGKPDVNTLEISGVGGEGLVDILPALMDELRKIAKEFKCKRMMCQSMRSGWSKVLIEEGFKEQMTPYIYEVK